MRLADRLIYSDRFAPDEITEGFARLLDELRAKHPDEISITMKPVDYSFDPKRGHTPVTYEVQVIETIKIP